MKAVTGVVFLTLLMSCATKKEIIEQSSYTFTTVVPLTDTTWRPKLKPKEAIAIKKRRGFSILTIDSDFYPKDTFWFEVTFNGFLWHRYRLGQNIMLLKVTGLPNTVCITPLDTKGIPLEASTFLTL